MRGVLLAVGGVMSLMSVVTFTVRYVVLPALARLIFP